MSDSIKQFFDGLAERGHDPALASVTGSVRFDVLDKDRTEHWVVQISKGDLTVSHKNAKADAGIRLARSVLEGCIGGTVNTMAAYLRGLIGVDGDFALMILFDRLFPGPPDSTGRVEPLPARSA
jgi:hypothetical protein